MPQSHPIGCPHIHEEQDDRNWFARHQKAILIGTGVTVACAAIPPLALYGLGFTASGVAAGSAAAAWQASIGTHVAAGGLFATCQSLGATAAGTYITGTAGVGIGWTTVGTAWGISKLGRKTPPKVDNNILIDLDGLEDEGKAIYLLLEAHKNPNLNLTIVGITTSNPQEQQASSDSIKNSLLRKKLKEAEILGIPIYRGVEDRWSGIVWKTMQYESKGKITIVTFGSLTSLSRAIRNAPSIVKMVNGVLITGENRRVDEIGTEFNPFTDVEAANDVLIGFHPTPLFLAHLHVCRPKIVTKKSSTGQKEEDAWPLTDSLLAAAMLIEPAVATGKMVYNAILEPSGQDQVSQPKMMMVVDKRPNKAKKANLVITLEYDLTLCGQLMRWAVHGVPFF